jgi:hypothetical protein
MAPSNEADKGAATVLGATTRERKFQENTGKLHRGRGCKAGTNDPFPLSLRIVPMAEARN